MFSRKLVKILKIGGVAVMPTDTIYGIVGSALKRKTVERIYRLRKRNPKKPFIILIASSRDLAKFGIRPDARVKQFLNVIWSGPPSRRASSGAVSVIFPCPTVASRGGGPSPAAKFRYLHRGTKALAFRVPQPKVLRALLTKTGPLVAPSANLEGMPPVQNIAEAIRYFGDRVDAYVKGKPKRAVPSLLIEIKR